MFDHVTIRVADRAASEQFYDTVLRMLAIERTAAGDGYVEWDDFSLAPADAAHPPTTRLHLGFAAPTQEHANAFWRAGTQAGHEDDGAPGPRPQYGPDYYGAFLRDPDDNSAEGVHHGRTCEGGNVDHLWIRVADLDASRRFYEAIAPHAAFGEGRPAQEPDRVHFRGDRGSFSIVRDDQPPTRNAHIAFPAPDRATVDAFHAAAVAAGYRDNGGPGERPQYHPGYYGAYVLDPDGNNVEVVFHDRSA